MGMTRLVQAVLLMTASAALGYLIGYWLGHPWLGTWVGASLVVMLQGARELIGAGRLIRWLQRMQEEGLSGVAATAPRDRGLWGELGYRVERLLRQHQSALVLEKARLADFLNAIEASPNGVMLINAEDQIVWCSRVSAQHFGLDPERDLYQRVTNLVRNPVFVATLQTESSTDDAEPMSLIAPAGGVISVLVRAYGGQGQRLVLSQDITERQRMEAMRRDFVANVSHEIRTPLTVLAGFVETMASVPLPAEEQQKVLGLMSQQAQRMQSLVADLLTLAQLEGSPRPTVDRWVPLAQLLQQVEVEARGLSGGHHQFEFPVLADSSVQGLEIAGHPSELLSALTNLVSNAVRYTPPAGRISVTWHFQADGRGVFGVKDTGIGIGREHLPRLTERFYRVDGSRSRETGGTGLGLSIVKHVAQRHDGELQLDSELGKGSQFRLVLPAVRLRRV
jgi:two-component system phosphate regulon sensor histidine kinase PhoR